MLSPDNDKSERIDPEADSSLDENKELLLSGTEFTGIMREAFDRNVLLRFQASGFSMSPFIRNADILTLKPANDFSPCIGDIVACQHPVSKRLVIHRVVAQKKRHLLIKGDNLISADGLVHERDILGKVIKVERGTKQIHIGLGPERFLIAYLARWGLLLPLLFPIKKILRPFIRKRDLND